jgi:hypothetical protein
MNTFCRCLLLAALTTALPQPAPAAETQRVDVARFDPAGRLQLPASFDDWVFIGTSLGMGYSQAEFDPDAHNMFQVVRMEPTAYQALLDTGQFVDGSQIALHFFGSRSDVSINESGFVMGGLHMAEIHYKDSQRFPDGFNFYTFNPGDTSAGEVALPNDCVACHKRDAAYDGVFVQFYPNIHEHLPAAIRAKLSEPAMAH